MSDGSGRTADGCVPEPYRYTSGTQFKHTAHYHGEQSGKCRNRDRILSDHYSSGMAGNNQPILFDNHGPDTRYSGPVKVAQTITSALGTGGNNTPLAVHGEPYCIAGNVINRQDKNGGNGCGYQQGVSYTLTTEDRHCVAYTDDLQRKKRVRKLIPLECERLMGFPDHWTDIPGASDSVRYRALGNSVAVPCVEYILCGIAYFLERQEGERDVHIPG